MNPSGKNVLITGGSAGIGLALAQAFIANGSQVMVCGRTLTTLEKAKRDNPNIKIAQCDVTNNDQIMALRETCITEFGGVDILINNAAIIQRFHMVNGSLSVEDQVMEYDINFGGPVRVTNYFLPHLLERPEAAVVNLTSALAFMPTVASPIYSATKAALRSWTLSLRKQLADTNINVIELIPPLVDTRMNTDYSPGIDKMTPEKHAEHFMQGFTNGRIEIAVGISRGLPMLTRIAPKMVFNMLNR